MITDDAIEVHFGFRLLVSVADPLTVIIIPVLTRPGNCGACSVGQVIRATPSKTHP